MILKAKHHPVIYPFFMWYARVLIRRNFSYCHIQGEYADSGLPVLVIANHFSWWDGFLVAYLNTRLLKRKFHFMMLEEQLRKYWFFNYSGGFAVKRRSRSVIETLRYTNELLSESKNMVLLFPQGEIESMHLHTFTFRKGLEHIMRNQPNPIQIVFLACLVDFFSSKKPGISLNHMTYQGSSKDTSELQDAYNEFFARCIDKQIQYSE